MSHKEKTMVNPKSLTSSVFLFMTSLNTSCAQWVYEHLPDEMESGTVSSETGLLGDVSDALTSGVNPSSAEDSINTDLSGDVTSFATKGETDSDTGSSVTTAGNSDPPLATSMMDEDTTTTTTTTTTTDTYDTNDTDEKDCHVETHVLLNIEDGKCEPRENVRFVFVTSTEYTGNLSLDGGGDLICAKHVQGKEMGARKLTGVFKPWLSTESHSIVDDFAGFSGLYVKYDPDALDNRVIVVSDNDTVPIDVTEAGVKAVGGTGVWTGTKADRTWSGHDCYGWTAGALDAACLFTGTIGRTNKSDEGWTDDAERCCKDPRKIYCLQQSV